MANNALNASTGWTLLTDTMRFKSGIVGPTVIDSPESGGTMAETAKGNKIVRVKPYTREDGTKVPGHDRSTPDTSTGAKPPATRKAPPRRGK